MAKDQKQDIDLGIVRLEYGDAARPQRGVLTIETSKHYNGGLSSTAQVCWVGANFRSHVFVIGTGAGDFSKTVLIDRTKKATQKAIDTQHATAFTAEEIARLTQLAKDHYAAVVSAGVDGYKNTYPAGVTA